MKHASWAESIANIQTLAVHRIFGRRPPSASPKPLSANAAHLKPHKSETQHPKAGGKPSKSCSPHSPPPPTNISDSKLQGTSLYAIEYLPPAIVFRKTVMNVKEMISKSPYTSTLTWPLPRYSQRGAFLMQIAEPCRSGPQPPCRGARVENLHTLGTLGLVVRRLEVT